MPYSRHPKADAQTTVSKQTNPNLQQWQNWWQMTDQFTLNKVSGQFTIVCVKQPMFRSVILQQSSIFNTPAQPYFLKNHVNSRRWLASSPLQQSCIELVWATGCHCVLNSHSEKARFEKYFLRQGALGNCPSWREESPQEHTPPCSCIAARVEGVH